MGFHQMDKDISENKQELFDLLNTDIKTNIGKVPVLDYLEMKAYQYGYDSYEELYQNGGRIEGYEKISPKLIEEWRHHKEKERPSLKERLAGKQVEALLYSGDQKNLQSDREMI